MTTVDEDGETFRYIEAGEPDAECCSCKDAAEGTHGGKAWCLWCFNDPKNHPRTESMVHSTSMRFDSRGTTTAEVTCIPTQTLLDRVVALPGRRELTIVAPVDPGVEIWAAGEVILAGVMAGTVEPREVRFEVSAAPSEPMFRRGGRVNAADLVLARDGSVPRDGFRRGDLVAVRIPKPPKWPPLCRWAAIKPGQPWRLV